MLIRCVNTHLIFYEEFTNLIKDHNINKVFKNIFRINTWKVKQEENMSDQLPLSSLSNFDRIIARSCMKNPNAKALTEEEISLFLKKKESICINIGDTYHKEQPDALYYENPAVKKSIIDTEVASLNDNNKAKEIQEISDMITTAVKNF